MSDPHETTGPDRHDRLDQLFGSIVDAAAAAARMPAPAVPWRRGRRRRARLAAQGAGGLALFERWFFTTDARAVDLSTTVPYRSTRARPSDTARVVDLRFSAGLPARERTAILVALEERGAHIILKDGDRRYGLEHVIPEHWDAVRARLDAERAAGRVTYTVRTVVVDPPQTPTQTPGSSRSPAPGATPGPNGGIR